MSGPKISVSSLTGWAKRVVEGQIQCERRGLHCAEQIRSLLAECSGMGSELDKALATLELWQRRCGGAEKQIEEVRTLQRSMDQEIQKIRREYDRNIPRISSKYVISEEALKQKKRELEKLNGIRNKAQVLRDRLDQAAGAGRNRQKKVYQTIAGYLAEGADISAGGGFDAAAGKGPGAPAGNSPGTPVGNGSGTFAGNSPGTPVGNGSGTLAGNAPGVYSGKDIFDISEDIGSVLSFDLEDVPEENTSVKETAGSKETTEFENQKNRNEEAFREKNQAAIREKNEAAFRESYIRSSQAYIADCVDEVMRDMGYDLIGRRQERRKSGRPFRNELYQFGEGTAVNITYSPEGQISMELGGITREDRRPTAGETEVLTQEMRTFCSEFSEFERRMKAKGIIVGSRIALSPPTADHAAMINIRDYDIGAGRQITEMNVAAKRKKTGRAQGMLRRRISE